MPRPGPLAILLLLAAALRLVTAWGASVHHPDEVFQYLEQAHRLVFGYGYIPWEYRDGMRSWLVPLLLAGPMALGDALAPGTAAYVMLPRLTVTLATLGIVWGAWTIGARVSQGHALIAGFVAAIWFEQVYFASHTLTETIATAAAVPGLALLGGRWSNVSGRPQLVEGHPAAGVSIERAERTSTSAARPGSLDGALLLAGALLAFAALVRFHYAPVLAVAVAWRCRVDARAWRAVILGALPILAAAALVDLAMGMPPFGWMWTNIRRNVIDNAAATYGVSGPLYYLAELRAAWGWGFVPIVFLAIFGSRHRRDLLVVAVLIVALHMAIGHKEPRFILLATTLIVILAALGTADLIAMRTPARRKSATALALAGWGAVSIALALAFPMRLAWSSEAPALSAAMRAGQGKLCGLATWDLRYWQPGGYTFLHRDVPIYPVSASDELGTPIADRKTLARIAPGFDAILTTAKRVADLPPGYARIVCRAPPARFASPADQAARAVCLYRRAGGCDPAVAAPWRLR